jgi:ketosteroid isomerase-like protein
MDHRVQAQPTAIERLFQAVQRNDVDQVLALLHPSAEWTPTVWSGEAMYRGEEGIHLWLSQFGEDLKHLDIRVQKVEIRGDHGAVLGIVFDTRGDRTFAVEVAWSYEMEGDLLRRGRAHNTWEEALEAAGLAVRPAEPSPSPTGEIDAGVGRRAFVRVRQALRPNPECPVGRHFCRRSRR